MPKRKNEESNISPSKKTKLSQDKKILNVRILKFTKKGNSAICICKIGFDFGNTVFNINDPIEIGINRRCLRKYVDYTKLQKFIDYLEDNLSCTWEIGTLIMSYDCKNNLLVFKNPSTVSKFVETRVELNNTVRKNIAHAMQENIIDRINALMK